MTLCPRCAYPNADTHAACARCNSALPKGRSPLKAMVVAAFAGGMIVVAAVVMAITLAVHSATPESPTRTVGPATSSRPATEGPATAPPTSAAKPSLSSQGLLSEPKPSKPAPGATSAPSGEPASPAPRPEAAREPVETIVYVTRTGSKYHRDGCQYLRQSRIPMKLSEAKKLYEPCSVCRPPT